MNSNNYDVIVIGGGAAGLACAITAARRGKSVCILEKNPAPGKKIYATGNGRCNITNRNCENAAEVLAFFHSIGLEIVFEDEGRGYPKSGQAADVVFFLERAANSLGVTLLCSRSVDWIRRAGDGYEVSCGQETFTCSSAVIATGGKAAPKFGTVGDGYALAQSLGHKVNKPVPVLTAVECEGDFSRLKGVRAKGRCTLFKKGRAIFEESGEVQFTDYGLSGICIFNLSRHLLLDEETAFSHYEISLDFSGGNPVSELLRERRHIEGLRIKDALRGLLPEELAAYIVEQALEQLPEGTGLIKEPIGNLSDSQAESIGEKYGDLRFAVKGAKGWQMAQCTKGGVSLDEIDMSTMESTLSPGLFVAGEVLDYDGPCGGFNLQNAWETGIKAGLYV